MSGMGENIWQYRDALKCHIKIDSCCTLELISVDGPLAISCLFEITFACSIAMAVSELSREITAIFYMCMDLV